MQTQTLEDLHRIATNLGLNDDVEEEASALFQEVMDIRPLIFEGLALAEACICVAAPEISKTDVAQHSAFSRGQIETAIRTRQTALSGLETTIERCNYFADFFATSEKVRETVIAVVKKYLRTCGRTNSFGRTKSRQSPYRGIAPRTVIGSIFYYVGRALLEPINIRQNIEFSNIGKYRDNIQDILSELQIEPLEILAENLQVTKQVIPTAKTSRLEVLKLRERASFFDPSVTAAAFYLAIQQFPSIRVNLSQIARASQVSRPHLTAIISPILEENHIPAICQRLGLGEQIQQQAETYYEQAKRPHGNWQLPIQIASIYAAARVVDDTPFLQDIAVAADISMVDAREGFRLLIKAIPNLPRPEGRWPQRLVTQLNLPEEIETKAHEIFDATIQSYGSSSKNTTGIAAAAIYLAIQESVGIRSFRGMMNTLADVFGISPVTIRANAKNIASH